MSHTGSGRGPRGRPRRLRVGALAAPAAGIVMLAAACGGGPGGGPGASPSPGRAQQLTAFAQCLRGHGQPNAYLFKTGSAANPAANSGLHLLGYNITGITPGSPRFAAAMKACRNLIPGGPPGPVTQQQKEQQLKFAACMRSHGYADYPDPQFRSGGIVQPPLPASIDTASPQFEAALKACNASG